MNNTWRNINRLLWSVLFTLISYVAICQSNQITFDNITINQVLKKIEKASDFVFNYDPELLSAFHYTGSVNLDDIDSAMINILYASPFTYEVDSNNIIVYRDPPKTYRICGTVVDTHTKEPLIGANIKVIQTTQGDQSDLLGFFDFDILAEKNQNIEISFIGYRTMSFSVQSIAEDECPSYPLSIDEDIMGQEIIIRDYLLDGISQGNSYGSFDLDYEKLTRNHSHVEHDILKTTQLLPGINSIDDSATNIQMRGSTPGQNLIMWDGVPLYNAGHIFGMISAINPFSVNSVRIHKGAHDPKYDNRVGGIIDVSQSDSITNALHGSLGTTLTEVHGNLDIPLVKNHLSLTLGGRQSINSIYNSPTLQSYTDKVFQFSLIDDQSSYPDFDLLNTDQNLDYHDWSAKLLCQPINKLSLQCGIYKNYQDFNYSFSFDGDPFVSDDNTTLQTEALSAKAEYKISRKWESILSYYKSTYSNNYNREETEDDISIFSYNQSNGISETSLSFDNVITLSPQWTFNLGYENNKKQVTLDLNGEEVFDPDFVPLQNESADFHNVFMSIHYNYKGLKIDGGNRSTYYSQGDTWVHSPRISFLYAINDDIKLKADAGIYHQFINQLTNLGAGEVIVDNPLWILNASESQLSQKANKLSAGIVINKDGWLLDLEAYYNHTTGLTTFNPLFDLGYEENGFSQGSSTVRGLDALVKKRYGRLNTWINYSLGMARYNFSDIDDRPFSAPNDIRHILSVVTSYQIKKFQFSANLNYHSGLPYSRPDLILNEEEPDPEPPFLYYLDYPEFNNYRLRPYLRLDLNLTSRFSIRQLGNLQSEVSLSLINILNRDNITAREYYLDYNEDTDVYSSAFIQKLLLDRTPQLLVRFYW